MKVVRPNPALAAADLEPGTVFEDQNGTIWLRIREGCVAMRGFISRREGRSVHSCKQLRNVIVRRTYPNATLILEPAS